MNAAKDKRNRRVRLHLGARRAQGRDATHGEVRAQNARDRVQRERRKSGENLRSLR